MTPRVLRRRSGPTLGAIAVVSVGVGLAAMVFALADPYVARDLPYADPDRLVSIEFGLGHPRVMMQADPDNAPLLGSWQARTDLFEGLAAFGGATLLRARLPDRVVPLRAVAVTDNLLQVLGLDPRPMANAWVSNRAATVLSGGELLPGRSVPVMPGGTLGVGGILPPSFLFPWADQTVPVDALVMLTPGPVITIRRTPALSSSQLRLVGRTRQGVTPEMIESALSPSVAAVGRTLSVAPLWARMTARQQELARGAALASALVIVVCWMNVFNIALTRGLYREAELATRTALGATPGQLVRLMVTDGLRVATLGSAGALAVAWVALAGAVRVLPAEFATMGVPALTMRVATFIGIAGAVAWLSSCLASIVAWRLGARHHARHIVSRDGRAIRVMRFGVIAGQVGAASVLLAAAALLGRSHLNLLLVDAGMDERTRTVTVSHDPELPPAVQSEVIERVVAELRRGEGVQAVGVKSGYLLEGGWGRVAYMPDGQVGVLERVDRGFLDAAGLPFLVGGLPEPGQGGDVITQGIAAKHFEGRSPVGAMLPNRAVPIVGVVPDVRTFGLSVAPRAIVYHVDGAWLDRPSIVTYVMRMADGSPPPGSWQQILRPIDPMALVLSDGTVGDRLARSVRNRTFAALVVGLFATASVLVTALGLAGVVGYTVVKRTREIAVRLTLGATRPSVSWLVVREALTAAVCGAVGGVTASMWLSGALESLLYGIRPADPATLFLAAVVLLGIVFGAAILPAIRTGRIAPASALRAE